MHDVYRNGKVIMSFEDMDSLKQYALSGDLQSDDIIAVSGETRIPVSDFIRFYGKRKPPVQSEEKKVKKEVMDRTLELERQLANMNAQLSAVLEAKDDRPTKVPRDEEGRSKWIAMILCVLFGSLSADLFYVGRQKIAWIYTLIVLTGITSYLSVIMPMELTESQAEMQYLSLVGDYERDVLTARIEGKPLPEKPTRIYPERPPYSLRVFCGISMIAAFIFATVMPVFRCYYWLVITPNDFKRYCR